MSGPIAFQNLEIIVGMVVAVGAAYGAWRNTPQRGSKTLAVFLLIAGAIQLFHLLVHLTPGTASDIFEKLQLLATHTIPIAFVAFAVAYTEREYLLEGWTRWLFVFWPAVIGTIFFLPPITGAVGPSIGEAASHALQQEVGVFFWTAVSVAFLLLAGGCLFLIEYTYRVHQLFRRQGLLILSGIALAWLGTIISMFELLGGLHFHASQVGLVAMGVLIGWGIFRGGLTDVTPVAWSSIIDALAAGVVIYDNRGRIIDANPRFYELVAAKPSTDWQGDSLETALSDNEAMHDAIEAGGGNARLATADGWRMVTVDVQQFTDRRGRVIGEAALCYDMTEQKRRQEDLDLLIAVFSRYFRHNIRNDLSVILGIVDALEQGEDGADAEQARETISDILEASDTARSFERAMSRGDEIRPLDIAASTRNNLAELETKHPTANIQYDLPDEQWVAAHIDTTLAIQNVLENGLEHNDTATPELRVTLTTNEESWVTLTVEDNGPGISNEEISAVSEQIEDDLHHASGFGLQLTNWIVDRSGGELRFDSSNHGSTVSLRFRAVDPST